MTESDLKVFDSYHADYFPVIGYETGIVDGVMGALFYSKDCEMRGAGFSGAGGDRNHQCGQWAGEGVAGDWEDQVVSVTVKLRKITEGRQGESFGKIYDSKRGFRYVTIGQDKYI